MKNCACNSFSPLDKKFESTTLCHYMESFERKEGKSLIID